jgi:asparagine synthase (glutamine-hydrolysing)
MCGIFGIVNTQSPVDTHIVKQANNTLYHRGPDDDGIFISNDHTLALGHTRLSFIDLSDSGKQPISSPNQKIHVTFNGEIYNYQELRKELEPSYHFQTQTDTEVIIAAYQTWGISFINKLKGMFAFGLYDSSKDKLYLVRDRFGIKPLYYINDGKKLIFASEIKAILASESVAADIDYSSLCDFFVYRYIPSPKTIWKNIYKIPSAHYLEFDTKSLDEKSSCYWELKTDNIKASSSELVKEIGNKITHSVQQHLVADVPIGSFLSGGYDSSALVYYMKSLGVNPKTFSIGFENWQKSEDYFAAQVAKHLNVENKSVIANEESLNLLDIMPDVYDEPIADISIIPTYMVSKLARESVKAVFSGEGADELFGGYTWQSEFMSQHDSGFWKSLFSSNKKRDTVSFYANAMSMGRFDRTELIDMLHPRLHQYIPNDVDWFYRKNYDPSLSPLKSIQMMDIKCFMGELVLTKVDRASMANSLEVRVPFLDHELFETVFSVNEQAYFKKDQTKYLLYQNIENHMPQEILNRKKQGFVGPDSYYMNMDYYKKELKNSTLVANQIINRAYVDALLKETYNWKLWKILVMEKWFKRWIAG